MCFPICSNWDINEQGNNLEEICNIEQLSDNDSIYIESESENTNDSSRYSSDLEINMLETYSYYFGSQNIKSVDRLSSSSASTSYHTI